MSLGARITAGLVTVATALLIELGRDYIKERRRRRVRQQYIDEMEAEYNDYMEMLQ